MLISLVLLTMLAAFLSADVRTSSKLDLDEDQDGTVTSDATDLLENSHEATIFTDGNTTFSTAVVAEPDIVAFFGNVVDDEVDEEIESVTSSIEEVPVDNILDVEDDVSEVEEQHPEVRLQKRATKGRFSKGRPGRPRRPTVNSGKKQCRRGCQIQGGDGFSRPKDFKKVIGRPDRTDIRKPCHKGRCTNVETTTMPSLKDAIPADSPLSLLTWLDLLPELAGGDTQSRMMVLAIGKPNRQYQLCTTPHREPGHCRLLQYCVLSHFIDSFSLFLKYLCYTPQGYVGVCCPDYIYQSSGTTSSTTTTTTTTTEATTTSLPASSAAPKGCGYKNKRINRIVGGQMADPHEWPWMAALIQDGDDYYCGGVLITNQHILTASHCVDGKHPNDVVVRLGEYNFNNSSSSAVDFNIIEMVMHEGYESLGYQDDIAILRLDRAATFNDAIWPVCLPSSGEDFFNVTAIVTGWGTIYYGGPTSDVLMEVLVPVWSNHECEVSYSRPIRDTNLCAGGRKGGMDSCQGDSGGPLLYEQSDNSWSVIGIVSWGLRCADPKYPGVYTRVNMYLDWIKENARFD